MNFDVEFPLKFWINLGRREDRRVMTESQLAGVEVMAERFSAVDGRLAMLKSERFVSETSDAESVVRVEAVNKSGTTKEPGLECLVEPRDMRGYESVGRYALALTQRLALREAARRKAPAVLLLEDDAVFHPQFQALIASVELPDDWGIFYLGCSHSVRPEWAGSRVVRVGHAVDTHAVAVRAPYYRRVMQMLDRHGKANPGVAKASDQFLALLHREIPTYACYPNLVWQDTSSSDLLSLEYSNYTIDGRQKNWEDAVEGLLGELVESGDDDSMGRAGEATNSPRLELMGAPTVSKRQPKLGLLFLTRGDVHHPEIWREFVEEEPGSVRVFSHAKFPGQLRGGFLEGSEIRQRYETAWGTISLVRASRALLLEALEDESLTHFALLSESCVPIRPLPEILRRLELDPRPQFSFKTLKQAVARHVSRIGAVPQVPIGCWRFQSQWWLMDRAAAVFAAGEDFTPYFEKMFVPDEAYFATVLSMQGYPLEGEVLKKDVTWTWWEKDAGSPNEWPKLPMSKVRAMLHSGAMFARKFPKGADIGKLGLHRSLVSKTTGIVTSGL